MAVSLISFSTIFLILSPVRYKKWGILYMKNNKVMIVDLNSTTPIYSAYFCHALNSIGLKACIAGIENRNETRDIRHLEFSFLSWTRLIERTTNKYFNKLFKPAAYLINWLMVLIYAPRFLAVHFQWLPLSNYSNLEIYLLKLLLKRNNNIFLTVHNILPHDSNSEAIRKRYLRIYQLIPELVVHTDKTRRILIDQFRINNEKITTMPHGPLFAEMKTEGVKREEKLIGMIGTIRPYKGVEDAVKIVSRLKEQGYKLKLLLAGKGPEEYTAHLEQLIDRLGLESYVIREYRYLELKEMIKYFQSVRAVIAPYKRIDQSGAVITAISLGTPVIAYKVGGLKDIIRDKYNGRLLNNNDIDELARGVSWVLKQDPTELEQNCLLSVEKISWKRSAGIIKTEYCRCL